MIISSRNPKIQWVRRLQSRSRQRRESHAFVVEGVRLSEEALSAGWQVQLVLHTPDLGARGQAVLAGFASRAVQIEEVSPEVMQSASDTQSPQGILAVLSMQTLPLPEALDFAFIPDGMRDPGNLGAILRTAAAAGVQVVYLPPEGVDPFSPKVVRAAMGAHFRLPLIQADWAEIRAMLIASGLQVYLAAAGSGAAYTQADFRRPLALIVGGEAEGAGETARQLAHTGVHIPMPGNIESLNAATAAAILLFEVRRQRGIPTGGIP